MKNYGKGLFVGRFQPLHKGHLDVIEKISRQCDEIVIVIGSANRQKECKNPLSYEERKTILESVLKKSNINYNIEMINDIPDDDEWMKELLKIDFDAIYSSNPWVLELAKRWNSQDYSYDIIGAKSSVRSKKNNYISSTMIRNKIADQDDDWRALVPLEVADMIDSRFKRRIKQLCP